jgi:hypothetical protein
VDPVAVHPGRIGEICRTETDRSRPTGPRDPENDPAPRLGGGQTGCDEADTRQNDPIDAVDPQDFLARAVLAEGTEPVGLLAGIGDRNRLRGDDPREQSADENEPCAEREDEFRSAERNRGCGAHVDSFSTVRTKT